MRAGAWLAVTQNARAAVNQPVARRGDVSHLVTNVMNASTGVFIEKALDGGFLTQRM